MIIDITGTILIPGNCGINCPGNGEHEGIECCCNECDYLMCCLESHGAQICAYCRDKHCPNVPEKINRKTEK